MEKNGPDSSGLMRYRLFCRELLLNDTGFPQISRIKPIFESMTHDEFMELTETIIKAENYDLTTQLFYFLLLFRDMPHLQEYINSPHFKTEHLEKFIMFVHGFCSLHELSTVRIIDDVLYFLSRERLLELAMNSQFIARDKLLLFFILTKLETRDLNRYFSSLKDIAHFKTYFMRLPDMILKTMISRNYQLFQYIMMLMMDGDSEGSMYADFFNKYRTEMEQFSRLHDFLRQYRKELAPDSDRSRPFNERDMGRISFLVNSIKGLPNPEKAIQYFSSESVFIDDFERRIIQAIVTNPVLKNVFHDADNPHDGEMSGEAGSPIVKA